MQRWVGTLRQVIAQITLERESSMHSQIKVKQKVFEKFLQNQFD